MRIEGGKPPSPLKLCFIPFFLLGCVNKTVLAHRDVHNCCQINSSRCCFLFYKGLKTAKLCNTKVFLLVTELTAPQIPAFTPGAASNRLASTSQDLHRLASVHRAFTSELLYQQVFPPTICLQQPPFAPTIFLDQLFTNQLSHH